MASAHAVTSANVVNKNLINMSGVPIMASYGPVVAGPDRDLLNSLDSSGLQWCVIQGGLAARAIYGIYKSLRVAEVKTNGKQNRNPTLPLIYLAVGGLWYLVTL